MKIIQPSRKFKEKLKIMPGNYLTSLLFLIILFTVGTVVFLSQAASETELLQEELADYIVLPVTVGTKTYDVINGRVFYDGKLASPLISKKVLRIARYSVENRLDPIFSIEGTDPELFKDSITLLTRSLETYVSLYEKKGREDDAKIFSETLYPIDFLSKLAELEKLRKLTVTTPSTEIIQNYDQQLTITIDAYILYIEKLKKALGELDERDSRTTAYFGGLETIDSILNGLTKARQSAFNKHGIRKNRIECFMGNDERCTPLSLSFNQIISIEKNNTQDLYISPSPPDSIQKHYSILSQARGYDEESDIPIVSLIENTCLPPNISPSYFYVRRNDDNDLGNMTMRTDFLNELWFTDLNQLSQETLNKQDYLALAKSKGLGLFHVTPTNSYKCADSGKDTVRVNSLYTIRTLVKQNPLFSDIASPSIRDRWPDLALLEKEITTSDFLHEETVTQYMYKIRELLSEYGEYDLSKILSTEKVLFMNQILSTFEYNSGHLDEIFLNDAYTNLSNSILREARGLHSRGGLLRIRGYAFLFLLLFNESFVEQPLTLFSEKRVVPLETFHIITYPGSFVDKLSSEKLVDSIRDKGEFRESFSGR